MKSLFALALLVGLVAPVAADTKPKDLRVDIKVTEKGFEPGNINVPAKKPVTLVFTRKTEETCTKSVVISLDDGKKIERELPLDKPVEIAVTFPRAGHLAYACSMNMNKGTIVVE
ncbi:MAG TPA: cupredoxin domain-containing protein [Kofleriaceae bacterium]